MKKIAAIATIVAMFAFSAFANEAAKTAKKVGDQVMVTGADGKDAPAPDGEYMIDGQKVHVKGGKVEK